MKRILLFILLTTGTLLVTAQKVVHSPAFQFQNGATSTDWIDFDFSNGTRVIVPAKIGGQETKVLLLTGVTTSKIDKGFAASIGLQPGSNGAIAGTGGPEIQFGNLSLRVSNDTVMELGSFSRLAPFLLGDDLFNNLAVDIDFAHHRIAFRDPNSITKPAGAIAIPLIRGVEARSVPVSVEGGAPAQFEFFLGDPSPLTIYQTYYEAHHLLENRPTSLRLGGGIGSGALPREPEATLKHAWFAGVDFARLPAVFTPDSVRGSDSTVASGNIGLELIARFHIIIDYPHDLLYAIPYTETVSAPFSKDKLGLSLTKQDTTLTVLFVSPGSPAELAGLKAGDKITQINEKPLQDWSMASLSSLLRSGVAGTKLEFTLEGGKVRQVKMDEFF